MTATGYKDNFPRGALIGAAALIALAMVAAITGRVLGVGKVVVPPGAVAEARELRFEDAPNGAVLVRAAEDGRVVDTLAPQSNHFVRGTVRGLVRERKREKIGAEPPFRLSRLTDGRLILEDPATKRRVDLDAFGRSNVGAFAAIMDAARKAM